jgi:hypothetical protein
VKRTRPIAYHRLRNSARINVWIKAQGVLTAGTHIPRVGNGLSFVRISRLQHAGSDAAMCRGERLFGSW